MKVKAFSIKALCMAVVCLVMATACGKDNESVSQNPAEAKPVEVEEENYVEVEAVAPEESMRDLPEYLTFLIKDYQEYGTDTVWVINDVAALSDFVDILDGVVSPSHPMNLSSTTIVVARVSAGSRPSRVTDMRLYYNGKNYQCRVFVSTGVDGARPAGEESLYTWAVFPKIEDGAGVSLTVDYSVDANLPYPYIIREVDIPLRGCLWEAAEACELLVINSQREYDSLFSICAPDVNIDFATETLLAVYGAADGVVYSIKTELTGIDSVELTIYVRSTFNAYPDLWSKSLVCSKIREDQNVSFVYDWKH